MKKSVLIVHHGRNLYAGNSQSLIQILKNIDLENLNLIVACCKGPLQQKIKSMGYKTLNLPLFKLFSYKKKVFGLQIVNPLSILYFALVQLFNYFIILTYLIIYKIDIVHSNTQPSKFYSSLAAKTLKKKVIWHEREVQPKGLRRQINNRISNNLSDVIIAVSKAVANTFENQNNIEVIYNAINLNDYKISNYVSLREELKLEKECILIGFVGRFIPWKGLHVFLDSIEMVIKDSENVHFVVVGDSTEERFDQYRDKLVEKAKKIGLQWVSFLGLREDIPNIMRSIDILVVPSTEPEPFGRVVIEGLAGKTAVIGSNLGGIPEIITEQCGVLVPPNNSNELAKKILYLLKNKKKLDSLKRNAPIRAKEFDVTVHTNRIQNIYMRL